MNDNEILAFFNLKDNPFKLEIILETFVGYDIERKKIIDAIQNKEKIILVIGPTGAGKTTLLMWEYKNLNIKNKLFLYRPFNSKEELEKYLIDNSGLLEKIKYKLFGFDLIKYLKNKNYVFFIDEATFMSDEMLEWLKILSDQTNNTFILAGLPEFEERILKLHRTLYERILTKIYLKSLDAHSGYLLIKKRLELSKNPDLFTDDAINEIYKIAGGFPREMLKIAYNALLLAYREKKKIIDLEIIKKLYEEKRPPDKVLKLTEKQKFIIELIVKYGPKTSSELLKLAKDRYSDITIHAISTMLKRMVKMNYLVRTKINNRYIYDVPSSIKNYFIREINR